MANTRKVGAAKMGVSSTQKVEFNQRLFEQATIGELKSAGSIPDDCDLETESAAYIEALELFNIHNGGIEIEDKFVSAVEAVQAIAEWLAETNYTYSPPKKYEVSSFSVTISVPTGTPNATVAFTVNGTIGDNFDLEAAIFAAQSDLSAMIQKRFKASAKEKQEQEPRKMKTDNDEQIEFSHIRAQKFNGKIIHRLLPDDGQWQSFGIPLYPDEAKKAGIDLDDYRKEGDYELTGIMDVQFKPDGKPMRALNVELG